MDFAGWGNTETLEDIKPSQSADVAHLDRDKKHFLGEWLATAICGNDITSSCLYVSALAIAVSGIYAPLALLLVSLTLFLFRKIYSEVGSALPMNGGTYTLLLNTTSKKIAAAGACLTILSLQDKMIPKTSSQHQYEIFQKTESLKNVIEDYCRKFASGLL
ncbi:MAG: amino acid permease [Bdellovibrionales bacterium]|nr:amino acid permease [Bdellovibrionales bacterium]